MRGKPTLESARAAAFKESESLEGSSCIKIEGYNFNQGVNYSELLRSMISTGFQASNLGDAIQVVNQMRSFPGFWLEFWHARCL
ncbi:hypothetical protein Vadar_030878 [Vaccinium darrowii]|uniref:Uncharacterized protein n=1 Tax=Vaccinium darrowii TaxID=229202 RepID=A0ACB7Z803_9ERIC|nr:hypothetical protein Vadar_030878 [Vaccinium darrowii]